MIRSATSSSPTSSSRACAYAPDENAYSRRRDETAAFLEEAASSGSRPSPARARVSFELAASCSRSPVLLGTRAVELRAAALEPEPRDDPGAQSSVGAGMPGSRGSAASSRRSRSSRSSPSHSSEYCQAPFASRVGAWTSTSPRALRSKRSGSAWRGGAGSTILRHRRSSLRATRRGHRAPRRRAHRAEAGRTLPRELRARASSQYRDRRARARNRLEFHRAR